MTPNTNYNAFADRWQANAQLALDTIAMRPTRGIPTWILNDMQWSHLDEISGNPPGSYEKEPVRVYREFHLAAGVCFIDQWIPENPLSMRDQGYESDQPRGATTLPHGRPADVKRQIDWLVEKGPQVGLMLGCSSSVAPGVPIENIRALIEGFRHYRENGRS